MKVLCDVHIPYKLVRYFVSQGIEAIHVNHILDKWHTKDRDLSSYADTHNYVLLTKDADFRNSYFLQQSPKKLIRVCLGNISSQALIQVIEANLIFLKAIYEQTRFYLEIEAAGVTVFN